MRCLVTLAAVDEQAYNPAYHVKLQGLLYRLLSEAGYDFVHDEKPFKFVTFSNIFPPYDMEAGEERKWIVASPHSHLVSEFRRAIDDHETVSVGEQRFAIEHTSTFDLTPTQQGTARTGTPIVVRIPRSRCERYGIDPDYDDVYWKLEHPTEAFVEEIEHNLAHKYRTYYDQEPPERPYFTEYRPQKEVAIPIHYEDATAQTIATTWELEYDCRTPDHHRLIELAYDAGVGELNTTGFGFLNER